MSINIIRKSVSLYVKLSIGIYGTQSTDTLE